MYRSLIVDDEKNIRERMAKFFPWKEAGFEVVGTAENGIEALDQIKQFNPHVVITDIMMPVMNGLELAAKIKSSHPTIKVVILSAYDDFNYAQQAIRYGVKGYMLKPLIKEEFYDVMKKLANELNEDGNLVLTEKQHNQAKERMLVNIIKGENLERYEKNWGNSYSRVIIFSFDELFKGNTTFSIRQIIMEHANTYCEGRQVPIVFYGNNLTLIVSAFTPISKIDLQSKINHFSNSLQEKLVEMEVQQPSFIVGVGNVARGIDQISRSYSEAVYAYSFKYFSPNENVIFYQDLSPSHQSDDTNKELFNTELIVLEGELLDAIVEQNPIKISSTIHHFFELLHQLRGYRVSEVREGCYALIMMLVLHVKEKGFTLPSIDLEQVYHKIHELQSLNELKSWLKHMLEMITADLTKSEGQHENRYVHLAKEYVLSNYQQKITLKGMADQLFLHQAYFSSVFKRETGENFIDFINKIRVEKAAEYIRTTDYKMKEISDMVGFQSHSYFNKVFKKITGLSPLFIRQK